jgi:hypothetical protein
LRAEGYSQAMARFWLLEAPDWVTLEWAATRLEATRSRQAWAHLDAALYEFVARAELLKIIIACLEPRPSLN